MNPLVLTWPDNEPLGTSLRGALDAEPAAFSTRGFPDGETKPRRRVKAAGATRVVAGNSITHPSNDIDLGGLLAVAVRQTIDSSS